MLQMTANEPEAFQNKPCKVVDRRHAIFLTDGLNLCCDGLRIILKDVAFEDIPEEKV